MVWGCIMTRQPYRRRRAGCRTINTRNFGAPLFVHFKPLVNNNSDSLPHHISNQISLLIWNVLPVCKDAPPSPINSVRGILFTSVPINVGNTRRNFDQRARFPSTHAISALLFSIISVISSILFTILLALELRRVGRRHLVVGIGIRLLKEK